MLSALSSRLLAVFAIGLLVPPYVCGECGLAERSVAPRDVHMTSTINIKSQLLSRQALGMSQCIAEAEADRSLPYE